MKPFELFVYAISALVLIILLINLFLYFTETESNVKEIKNMLLQAQAQANLGKTNSLESLTYQKDFLLEKKDIEEKNTLVLFECINPAVCCIRKTDRDKNYLCDKLIDWDYDYVKTNRITSALTTIRCLNQDGLATCKIYLGAMPAQAKIDKLELIDANTGSAQIKIALKNTGTLQLAFGTTALLLYKKSSAGWIPTDYVSDKKEIQTIMSGEKSFDYWNISPSNSGEYRAEFTFEALNGGFDKSTIDFNIDKTNLCKIETGGEQTVFDSQLNVYEEIHYCAGCSYSFECANIWNKKLPQTSFVPIAKDSTYCVKQTQEGGC